MVNKLFFGLALLVCCSISWGKSLPNVVLILVDDMGYGDLGCYNENSKIPTPHIDSLAEEGMRFTDAHSAGSVCHPSRYGLMTGQLPFRINYSVWREQPLIDENRVTVASMLKGEGYRTAMVGKWHLGFKEDGYENRLPGGPVDRGFDTYFGMRASTDIPPYFYIEGDRALVEPYESIDANYSDGWTKIQGAFWREGGIAPNLQLEDVLPRFTDEAVGVIRDHSRLHGDDPLFLYLAYPAPHTPWLPSEEFLGSSGASMYGDFMVMVDHMVGRVMKALEESGMEDDTIVLFSSDNGPVWYPTDVKEFGHDSVEGLSGMKGDAWEGGHRMPFIVRWPGDVKSGSVSDELICFTDFFATMADVIGREPSSDEGPDSISFLPVLKGRTQGDRESLVLESARGLFSVRDGKWKYINGKGSGGFSDGYFKQQKLSNKGPKHQLYNLEEDPGETTNLAAKHPDVVKRLDRELQRVLKQGFYKTDDAAQTMGK
ncbi:sulfatase family protein [Pelagicoccus mobilis]|uniref:Arylsulfatase n=1 Tax=Pelagicoccus mobilis TaxID=415221 RepID=A0A934S0L7_9BACT|nr:arylsulfatase [Pelagicoccus mobilis]MBK1879000.1 arylsulfatase [Pelagicoccus mobilis]